MTQHDLEQLAQKAFIQKVIKVQTSPFSGHIIIWFDPKDFNKYASHKYPEPNACLKIEQLKFKAEALSKPGKWCKLLENKLDKNGKES